MSDRPGQIGDYWLSQRPNSPQWCRTWFDPATRQTRRVSLGTGDFAEAQGRLAEWYVLNVRIQDRAPEEVEFGTVLDRYYEQHAKHLASGDQARIAIAHMKKHLPALVSELGPQAMREFVDPAVGIELKLSPTRPPASPTRLPDMAELHSASHRRGICAALRRVFRTNTWRSTKEEVNEDRLKFAQTLIEEADDDIKTLGLELDVLKIQNVSDDRGYLDSIGRQQSAEIIKRSRIAEAKAKAATHDGIIPASPILPAPTCSCRSVREPRSDFESLRWIIGRRPAKCLIIATASPPAYSAQ